MVVCFPLPSFPVLMRGFADEGIVGVALLIVLRGMGVRMRLGLVIN